MYMCTNVPTLATAMNDESMIKPHIDMILAESEMYMYEEMPVKYVCSNYSAARIFLGKKTCVPCFDTIGHYCSRFINERR